MPERHGQRLQAVSIAATGKVAGKVEEVNSVASPGSARYSIERYALSFAHGATAFI
jgi:hypothetical protein